MIHFKPLASDDLTHLRSALRSNASRDNLALLTGRDTGFRGVTEEELPEIVPGALASDAEVIFAIKAQPTHY